MERNYYEVKLHFQSASLSLNIIPPPNQNPPEEGCNFLDLSMMSNFAFKMDRLQIIVVAEKYIYVS